MVKKNKKTSTPRKVKCAYCGTPLEIKRVPIHDQNLLFGWEVEPCFCIAGVFCSEKEAFSAFKKRKLHTAKKPAAKKH